MLRGFQRGDTIIEVLLAVTVFSLVSVGSMAIMNRSANTAQQAIEITLVRQQIDAQVEALRAAHQAYSRLLTQEERDSSMWVRLTSSTATPITPTEGCPKQEELRFHRAFIMNPQSASMLTTDDNALVSMLSEGAPVFPQFDSETGVGYGLWIEPTRVSADNSAISDAYNFRVRACWFGPGMSTPMNLETIVRLYDVG